MGGRGAGGRPAAGRAARGGRQPATSRAAQRGAQPRQSPGEGAKGRQAAGPWQRTGQDAKLVDLLGQVVIGLVAGFVALVVIDGIFALLGLGSFGHASGWLAAILPVWLFAEEFRAWSGVVLRIVVAVVAAAVGVVLGSAVGGLADFLPPLGVGAIGAVVATLSYTVLWYFGVRWLAHRTGT